ncbi:MAG TPA: hypothetical protein VJB16_06405, partial [archaeon]|nr:hypothetical protein [archaeon]
MPQLEVMDMSENLLDSWPLCLVRLPRLVRLNLGRNRLISLACCRAPPASSSGPAAEQSADATVGGPGGGDVVGSEESVGAAMGPASESVQASSECDCTQSHRVLAEHPLAEVNISFNQLGDLPAVFAHLAQLGTLIAHHNFISALSAEYEHPNLSSLCVCDLSWNKLLSLPSSFLRGAPGLQALDLSENPLLEVPNVDSLSHLVRLDVSSSVSVLVPDMLPPSVRELSLANLRVNETLQEVSILKQGNGVSPDDPEFIFSFLLATAKALMHPVVVFAVAKLAEEEVYQALFSKEDGVRKLDQLASVLCGAPHARSKLYA